MRKLIEGKQALVFLTILIILFLVTVEGLAQNTAPNEKAFVFMFSYFKGNGEDGLHLAYSYDGYKWIALNNDKAVLKPEVGKDKLMRDPCIIKGGDGLYHMVWTTSWTDVGIGYSYSNDLIHWSKQEFITVMKDYNGTRNTWAPEITFDDTNNVYMVYWASTIAGRFPETQSEDEKGYNHRIYYTLTKDFKTFSDTQLLYDPGFNVIDASIAKNGNGFIMFLKDETRNPAQKNIKIAFSETLTGPYTKASEPITGNFWAEGPSVTKIKGNWIVYFDKYIDKKYGALQSGDLKIWKDISEDINFPSGARHGSVFMVNRADLRKLQLKYEDH